MGRLLTLLLSPDMPRYSSSDNRHEGEPSNTEIVNTIRFVLGRETIYSHTLATVVTIIRAVVVTIIRAVVVTMVMS